MIYIMLQDSNLYVHARIAHCPHKVYESSRAANMPDHWESAGNPWGSIFSEWYPTDEIK